MFLNYILVYYKYRILEHDGLFYQGFSQDFRIACPKIHIWGELGPIPFRPIPLYTKNIDIRMSKRQLNTPLAKGLGQYSNPYLS